MKTKLVAVFILVFYLLPSVTLALGEKPQLGGPGLKGVKNIYLRVDGLACPFCALGLEKKLKTIEGVEHVKVSLEEGIVSLRVNEKKGVDLAGLKRQVKESGFTLRSINIEARGYLSKWKDPILGQDNIVFNLQNSEQRLLLLKMSEVKNIPGIWGKPITIKGEIYEHKMKKAQEKLPLGLLVDEFKVEEEK